MFDQAVEIAGVVEQMARDAHAAYVRGVADRDQDLLLLQKIHQRDVVAGLVEGEGDDAGALPALFGCDHPIFVLVKLRR